MPAMNADTFLNGVSSPGLQDMDGHFRSFAGYVATFRTGEADHDFHLDLKAEHSRNVFFHARALADDEACFSSDPVLARALLLAALFHDAGRFPQYDRFRTFSDAASVNHAHLAVREVKRRGFLNREAARVRHLALAAIGLHNRFSLPSGMDAGALAVTKAVRDADKLDIMRGMAGHLTGGGPVDPVIALHVTDSPEASPAVLEAVMAGRLGLYSDMATTTDFKLLVCGWLYDLTYAWSRREAASGGHLAVLAASLPETEQLGPFRKRYREDLASHARS